tara:strand:+ start:18443 stop:18811 length:369 start_codon:yes stop_codon:yes gene_type:complete
MLGILFAAGLVVQIFYFLWKPIQDRKVPHETFKTETSEGFFYLGLVTVAYAIYVVLVFEYRGTDSVGDVCGISYEIENMIESFLKIGLLGAYLFLMLITFFVISVIRKHKFKLVLKKIPPKM